MTEREFKDIEERAVELARPFHEIADRQFYGTLRDLTAQRHQVQEHKISEAVERAAGQLIAGHIEIAGRQLGRVLDVRSPQCTGDEIKALLAAVTPNLATLRTQAYQRANSLGFGAGPGFGIAMDDAERLTMEVELGTLRLHNENKPGGQTHKQGPHLDFSQISVAEETARHLERLWDEAATCHAAGTSLATVFTLGSLLEGALQAKCQAAGVSDAAGMSLSQLIDLATERGWLHQTRSRFGDVLRNYRNYVHPDKALREGHTIDQGAASICWQVVTESLRDLGLLEQH